VSDATAPLVINSLVARIDDVLPQTQCKRCGYTGCRPYAEAIARGAAAINRCPPGGEATLSHLASITGQPLQALDPTCGAPSRFTVAAIDEATCIGCTLCIQACPVDAISGAAKLMHAVLEEHCTGCALCIPPCPVDCIAMIDAGRHWSRADASLARSRFAARNTRLAAVGSEACAPVQREATPSEVDARTARRSRMGAALERARNRRHASG
jgi:electron transport complex protein RnfB